MIRKLYTFIILSITSLAAHTQNIAYSGMMLLNDTVNVEKYDDQKLKPYIGSTSTVPFFHHTEKRFWYSWQEAGEKSCYKVWDIKKGKYVIDSIDKFDTYKYKQINPYGTSPDSIYRLSEDNLNNLYLEKLTTHEKVQLTNDGTKDYKFEIFDIAWLEDNNFIIMRRDNRGIREFSINYSLNSSPMNYSYQYATPGDSIIGKQEIYLGNLEKKTLRKIDCHHWKWQQIELQKADGVKNKVFFWRNKRTCDIRELFTIDKEGNLKMILTEESKPRINPDMFACKIVNNGNDIFIWSDRSGWGHYYHYDGNGKLLNQVTTGNWTAGRILSIDEKSKEIFLLGYGREKDINPNYSLAYKVKFNGKGLKPLTPENASHNVFVSYDNTFLVDIYSRVDMAPTVCVKDGNGKLLQVIEKTNISKLLDYGWKCPEMFEVKAADGKTTLYGLMWKPYDFDENKKYPIISQVYPGPFTETVWNDFTVYDRYHNAALAQRGYIVVVFGHRGSSPFRSKEYNVYGYGNLRDYALADDKAGLEELAKKYSFIDISRVGIVGHSGGGMMAAAALMTYPDFYKVAVASSGNYDNYIYNRFWGETYQGINEEGTFKVKTNAQLAKNLKGHLLLVTGDADRNVHPAHTQRLVEALIQANKDFDLLVLPGQEHHYDEMHQQYFERRKRDFFDRWLK